jgi:hypothetical protein
MKTPSFPARLLATFAACCFLAFSTGSAFGQTEIVVEQPPGANIDDGDTLDFANAFVGVPKEFTFTIKNTGDAELNGIAVTIDGTHASEFKLNTNPGATVAAGADTTFEIQFTPTAVGPRTAAIHIASNDADESPFDILLAGNGETIPIGTDTFGYQLNPAIAPSFLDLVGDPDAQAATGLVGDDVTQNINLGFTFSFYENTYTSCSASTNGLITFGAASTDFTPDATIPAASSPNNLIAAFWTDLRVSTGGKVLFATKGVAPNRVFILQYDEVELYSDSGKKITLQVQLYEGTNSIEIQYKKLGPFVAANTARVATGIENSNGTLGIQYENSLLSAGLYSSGPFGIRFTRPVRFEVQSTYLKPGQTTPTLLGNLATGAPPRPGIDLNPGIGPGQQAYGSVARFEAPEYIYLNSLFQRLNEIGGIGVVAPFGPASITNGGAGYTSAPDITFVGGGGTGAAATATVSGGVVTGITLTNGGTGYTFAPTLVFSGGGGTGAAASTTLDDSNLAVYRLVNDGYSIDGQVVQGTQTFFTSTLTRDVTVIWRWKLQFAVFVEAVGLDGFPLPASAGSGVGNPSPGVGRSWVDKDVDFTAAIDRISGPDFLGSDTAGFRFSASAYQLQEAESTPGPQVPLGDTGNRLVTESVTINNWYTVKWVLSGQVRYRFDSVGHTGESFVRVFKRGDTTTLEPATQVNPNPRFFSSANQVNEVWVDIGRKVEVGSFYRTANECFTLMDFPTPPGGDLSTFDIDISAMQDRRLEDAAKVTRTARVYVVDVDLTQTDLRKRGATRPTEVHFVYQPTIFRAEIALGMSLDAVTPDAQLVPNLCSPGVLRRGTQGPNGGGALVGLEPDGTPAGSALRWDQVANLLFPVHPGTYHIDWPDLNDPGNTSYRIEVVAGYPGDSAVPLLSERELENGMRETTTTPSENAPPVLDSYKDPVLSAGPGSLPLYYVTITTFNQVSEDFPGHSDDLLVRGDAHYRHLFDTAARQAPTKLDLLATDQWNFLDLTFSDSGSQASTNDGVPGTLFETQGEGRSVLLYSVRPNPDEAADGNLAKESLVVRVVRSEARDVLFPDDEELVLGRRGLELDGSKNLGIVQRSEGPTSLDPGNSFVLDFWLNASGLRPSDDEVTILSTGSDKLKVTLDAETSTITATYLGVAVTHPFSTAGSDWRHYTVHVFQDWFFSIGVTMVDFYVDGVRAENGTVTAAISGMRPAISTVGTTVGASSIRFGVNADPLSRIQIDQVRLFSTLALNSGDTPVSSDPWLTSGELAALRTKRVTNLRTENPTFRFGFEAAPTSGSFANNETSPKLGVGPVLPADGPLFAGTWARLDIQELATRLTSTLDNAGFGGSGYVINAISNYNPDIYSRGAEVGTWGQIFPVNDKQLFVDPMRRLEVAYYENRFLIDEVKHPNVAWPFAAARYDEVIYPTYGPHKDKAIYIASRLGSEGVDRNGYVQEVFNLDTFANLAVYNQPDRNAAGYNPNEEHGLAAGSNRAALKIKEPGEELPNNPPLAAFALQNKINVTAGAGYTSDSWVLVKVDNLVTGEPEMAAYEVFQTRDGTIPFPRPNDTVVNTVTGLDYESAEKAEDRFLTTDPAESYDFSYQFNYLAKAGDLLIPPYPLNLVIGNTTMTDARGKNVRLNGVNQRTLWRDVNSNAWVVSGNGRFFHQFFYPFRGDFYLPDNVNVGTPVAWLPESGTGFIGTGSTLNPVKVVYDTYWGTDYPKLKRGETLTYQGGEYFNETPGANGLPALVAMSATEVVYDSSIPSMIIGNGSLPDAYDLSEVSARIIRPLDRREVTNFTVAKMGAAGFTPAATEKLSIIAERWYFEELPGALQKQFYFDSLAQKLVYRGLLNGKESGDSDLTSGPDPINTLVPNILTPDAYKLVRALSTNVTWTQAIDGLFLTTQNPYGVTGGGESTGNPVYLSGVKNPPTNYPADLTEFWKEDLSGPATSRGPNLVHLDSFGVGSALVPSPGLLTKPPTGSLFVTIAENNRSELSGAPVSLHIVEIVPDRFRGAIQVIEAANPFSERVTLQHNGEFGGNTGDLYYEWWIRDSAPLDVVANEVLADGTLKEFDSSGNSLWQEYVPQAREENNSLSPIQKRLGSHTVVFEGRPDVTLADKLVLMRYRHKNESGWKLVPFEITNSDAEWKPGNVLPTSAAPFQWAGAANSPLLQADGSKRYIPQLVMGWVKRILDRINPYEARYTDFFSNESPATYSSQIQIAGGPFAGKVALNPDKNVIENVGLIELYETVLQRAKELSIDNSSNPVSTDGINQALLLAATRLSVLYELLAREAYSDAQDSTIKVTDGDGLSSVASFTHAFQNMEADLLHEELALLRGTDFRKSYPVFNRMFWNYAKGLGEAAYNVNYNIYDENSDGFINEDDARALFPQGHGDSWGHFLSAIDMHYELLRQPVFSWKSRSELYSLLQNVLEVDFLDEKTFAKLAAGKARAGLDTVRGTYRLNYTQEPDGQWQGYTDGADPARAWGVSEWAHRSGQGAYFDWAVANAILPEDAGDATPVENPENLDRLQRSAAESEIGEVASVFYQIQVAMDEANNGVNPLGFDADALTFDVYPQGIDGTPTGTSTHFEQIYGRAVTAGTNALATLDMATKAENKLRRIADDTDSLIVEAFRQDLDYRNRLIEIFGRPYDGTIGFGKVYPEGYEGPDTLLSIYLDRTSINKIIPDGKFAGTGAELNFGEVKAPLNGIANNSTLRTLYGNVYGSDGSAELTQAIGVFLTGSNFVDPTTRLDGLPIRRASAYAFQAEEDWGTRTSYGRVQRALEEMLREEILLRKSADEYNGFLGDYETLATALLNEVEKTAERETLNTNIDKKRKDLRKEIVNFQIGLGLARATTDVADRISDVVFATTPGVNGFSNDFTSWADGIADGIANAIAAIANATAERLEREQLVRNQRLEKAVELFEREIGRTEQIKEIEGIMAEIEMLSGDEAPRRAQIGLHLQELEIKRQEYVTALSDGFSLLREREAFNKILAAKVQQNRYQDMVFRLSRNEAMSKYQSTFQHAARYTWLAARAYDYETSLDPGDPAAPGALLDQIVKERQLGLWSGGTPQTGQGGLAEILNQLNGNFQVLKGQLGINNPQAEVEKISLRSELFRILPGTAGLSASLQAALATAPGSRSPAQIQLISDNQAAVDQAAASDDRWKDALSIRIEPDLTTMPEFVRHCRPFSEPGAGQQPGIVIRFSSHITNGVNFFGRPLVAGDHAYSTANFSTKIRGFGVWLENYNAAGLSTTPRGYMIPVGNDYLRTSSSASPFTRMFNVLEQRIPTPFVINQTNLTSPGFIPSLNGVDGGFGDLRRHGNFRMYHDAGGTVDTSELILDSRLIGRSVWNSDWLLIIPGAGLHVDPATGLRKFAETVDDIKLHFRTYSSQGQ